MKTPFYILYQRREKKRLEKIEKKKARLKNPVYVITPEEHGNGGWYGYTVHGVYELDWILKRNPVKMFHDGYYEPMFGSEIRLCKDKDPNKPLYRYDHEETKRWVNWIRG